MADTIVLYGQFEEDDPDHMGSALWLDYEVEGIGGDVERITFLLPPDYTSERDFATSGELVTDHATGIRKPVREVVVEESGVDGAYLEFPASIEDVVSGIGAVKRVGLETIDRKRVN